MVEPPSRLPRPPHTHLEPGETPGCDGKADLFFPEGALAKNVHHVKDIRPICDACPIYAPCLEWALHVREEGIWAGTTVKERRRLRQQRGIEAVHPVYFTIRGPMGRDA